METRTLGKVIGGAAIYKLQDHYLPTMFSFPMMGVDLAKIGLGVAEIALAIFGERKFGGIGKDIVEAAGIAGAVQVVSEVATAAGIASPSASPEVIVNSRYYAPEALLPTPTLVKVD